MREIPSKMEFHGFLGSLGNSDRSAHWAGGLNIKSCCPIMDFLYSRDAELPVLSSLYRDRVMEARFDVEPVQLPNRARAFDRYMFRREAWVARSGLDSNACCRLMPQGQGGPPGGAPSA